MGALESEGKGTVAVTQCRCGNAGFSEWLVDVLLLFSREYSVRKFVGGI